MMLALRSLRSRVRRPLAAATSVSSSSSSSSSSTSIQGLVRGPVQAPVSSSPLYLNGRRRMLSSSDGTSASQSASSTTSTSASTAASMGEALSSKLSIAPLPVRVALVGTTVGLLTPVYTVAGFAVAWHRYLPSTMLGQMFKYGLVVLAGGGLVKVMDKYVIPFLKNHSEFILPFAVSNTVTSSIWYLLGEMAFGVEALAGLTVTSGAVENALVMSTLFKWFGRMPLAGPGVGVLTAVSAPILWPYAFQLLWSEDMKDMVLHKEPEWLNEAYQWIVFPIGIPVGFLSGMAIQEILRPLIMGTAKQSWRMTAMPALVGSLGLGALYFTFCKTKTEDYFYIKRTNPRTGIVYSSNVRSKELVEDEGELYYKSRAKRDVADVIQIIVDSAHVIKSFVKEIRDSIVGEIRKESEKSKRDTNTDGFVSKKELDFKAYLKTSGARSLPSADKIKTYDLSEYERMLQFFDFLARYKYLSMKLEATKDSREIAEYRSVMSTMSQVAKDSYAIENLSDCWDSIVLGLIAVQKYKSYGPEEANDPVKKLSFVKALIDICNQRDKSKDLTRNKSDLAMLCANFSAFEAHLLETIDYRAKEEEKEAIQEAKTIAMVTNVGITAAAGLAIYFVASMLQ